MLKSEWKKISNKIKKENIKEIKNIIKKIKTYKKLLIKEIKMVKNFDSKKNH